MSAWEDRNFTRELANLIDTTTIAAAEFVQDGDAESFLLEVVKSLANGVTCRIRELRFDGGFHFVFKCADCLTTGNFAWLIDGTFDAITCDLISHFEEIVLNEHKGHDTLHFTSEGSKFFLSFDETLDAFLSKAEGGDEFSLWHFFGGTFDHDDVGLVTDINEVEITIVTLIVRWVDDELTIDTTNTHSADWACERNVGNAKSGGSTVDSKDVRIVLAISTEQESDDLCLVEVAFREQRAQWAVRHTAGQDFLLCRTAFAFEVATRELASSRSFFFVFHR